MRDPDDKEFDELSENQKMILYLLEDHDYLDSWEMQEFLDVPRVFIAQVPDMCPNVEIPEDAKPGIQKQVLNQLEERINNGTGPIEDLQEYHDLISVKDH